MLLCRRWGTAAEHRPVLCCAVAAGSRDGYRSAQDLTGQDSEQIVDIPVPGRAGGGGRGGLQGFPGQGSTAFSGAVRGDIPVPRSGGLQGSRPGQGSTASSSLCGVAVKLGNGFFALFPWLKKSAGLGPHSGSELGADFTPWTPAAYAESLAIDDDKSESESDRRRRWRRAQ